MRVQIYGSEPSRALSRARASLRAFRSRQRMNLNECESTRHGARGVFHPAQSFTEEESVVVAYTSKWKMQRFGWRNQF